MNARTAFPTLGLTLALRELRGGIRGFYVFIACIALGVMAIAGVGSLARSLIDGVAREGRVILGGDLAFTLTHREADAAERAFLDSQGRVSLAATLRAMARTSDGRAALVEVKAVDHAYPLYGEVKSESDEAFSQLLAPRTEIFGAVVDPALLARLDLTPGARVSIGNAVIELRAALKGEPDKLAGGLAFGPRLLMSEVALRATGLIQPGSLVRWHYRVRLPDGVEPEAVMTAARKSLPDAGWDIRSRSNVSPELGRNIDRFVQFLTLVGLTALLVGGVGVANAVKSHLDRKRDDIATMKTLGATGARVFSIYLVQVLLFALFGAGIGASVGATLPFLIVWLFGSIIPLPLAPSFYPGELLLAVLYGVMTALCFALWPLGRAHDVPVAALFRDQVAPERRWPRKRYMAATALCVLALGTMAIALAYERRIAIIFIGSAVAVFGALRVIAWLVMRLARAAPRPRSTLWRTVLTNIHRPGALTPSVVLSLGLGLALLVALTQIDSNLRRQLTAALPERAPAFFFVDIQQADTARFDAFVHGQAPGARLERVPMLRGRIVSAAGIRAENLKPPPHAAWVLQSDRGITYSGELPAGSRVVAGKWWGPDYQGPPLVSLENRIADGLGLKVGDPLVVNVLGRNITATVANLRAVEWQTLGINFVLVFSPGAFRGAPHADIATLTWPGGGTIAQELTLLKAVAQAFPAVTIVRIRDALEALAKVVQDLTVAARGASVITLVAAVLVLGGALATGHRHRLYDAVVLRTLGATRAQLLASFALEYLLLGTVTAVFGVAAGSAAAWLVVTEVMNLGFAWTPAPAAVAAFGALLLTVAFGLIGTFSVLGQKPAPVLRHL